MALPSSDDRTGDSFRLNRCRTLGNQLAAGRITFEEYAISVTLVIISAHDEIMQMCIDLIPPNFVTHYADYLRTNLEPVDFMPSPMPFFVGTPSEEEVKRAQYQLRPKYVRLYELVTNKLPVL